MSGAAWLQAGVLIVLIGVGTRLVGPYLARVYGGGAAPGDRVFLPVERRLYRLGGDRRRSASSRGRSTRSRCSRSAPSRWSASTCSSASRAALPLNPTDVGARAAGARVQHRRQLRHEHELAELRRRVDDEPPDADGRADGAELRLRRGRHRRRRRADPRADPPTQRRRSGTSGSTSPRVRLRVLLPLAVVVALLLASQGVVQTLRGPAEAHDGRGCGAVDLPRAGREPGGDQGARHERRRDRQRELGAPVREPDGLHEPRRDLRAAAIPFALTYAFGRLVGDQRQGWAIFAAMFVLWIGSAGLAMGFELDGNPRIDAGAPAATWRARRCASAPPPPALFAASTTGTSTGAVNAAHDSFTPARRRGAAREHDARRGLAGRRRRGPLRDARLRAARRLHRRADGRADARVPRQEDPGAGDEARRPLPPRRAARSSSSSRPSRVVLDAAEGVDPQPRAARALARSSTPSPRRRTTTARPSAG